MHQIYIRCFFECYGFVSLRSTFLLIIKWFYQVLFRSIKWSSCISQKRKLIKELATFLKVRYLDLQSLSAMNGRQFCNKNGIRTWTTLNDSEIEKEVIKSIAQVINGFLQNIARKKVFLFLKVFANLFFIP